MDPSTSLRTALLLRLTGDVLSSITGYPADSQYLVEILDWLDDLDQAWLAVLQVQVWRPGDAEGVDLVVDAEEAAAGLKSTPMNQTERARLRSLLFGGSASIEDWVTGIQADDVADMIERLGLQPGFNQIFSRTMDELGGLGGVIMEPIILDATNRC